MILDSIVRMTTVPELTIDEQWFNPQQWRFLKVSIILWPSQLYPHSSQSSATVDNGCGDIPLLPYTALRRDAYLSRW